MQQLELDPNKQYVLFLPVQPGDWDYQERFLHRLQEGLRNQGLRGNIVVMLDNPQDIRIIETPAPARD